MNDFAFGNKKIDLLMLINFFFQKAVDYRKKTRGINKKDEETENKRKEHQKSLLKLKQEELEERLKSGSFSLTQKKA